MAVSRQKGKARVSTLFYTINLNARQSGKANDSASIVKRAKERFRNSQRQIGTLQLLKEFESVNKLFLSA